MYIIYTQYTLYNMDMCYELSKYSACLLSYNFHYIELLGQRRKPRQRTSPSNWFVAESGFKCLFVCIKVSAFPDGHHSTKYSRWKLRGNSPSWEGTCCALLSFIFFDSGIAATAISSRVPIAVTAPSTLSKEGAHHLGSPRWAGTLKMLHQSMWKEKTRMHSDITRDEKLKTYTAKSEMEV